MCIRDSVVGPYVEFSLDGEVLVATLTAGLLAEVIGLRATGWLGPVCALVGAAIVWFSPVRHLKVLPPAVGDAPPIDAHAIAVAIEMEQPPGA